MQGSQALQPRLHPEESPEGLPEGHSTVLISILSLYYIG